MKAEAIIRRPIILTEKANLLKDEDKVIFEVHRDANKIQIRQAVETLFKVKVTAVNSLIMRGKDRRMGRGYSKMQNWKKAIVTLKKGESIDFFSDSETES